MGEGPGARAAGVGQDEAAHPVAAPQPPTLNSQPSALPSQPSTLNSQPPLQPPPIPDHELLRHIGRGAYGEVWLARTLLGEWRAVKIVYRSRFAEARPFEREFEGLQKFAPISRSHPSQLAILHVGKNDAEGCFYYVMELADDTNAPVAADVRRLTSPGARVASLAAAPDGRNSLGDSERLLPSDVAAAGDSRGPRSEPPHVGCYEPRTLRSDLERHSRLPIPDCVQIGLSLATALGHLHDQGLVHRDIKPSNIIFVNGVAKLGDIGLVTEAGDTQSIVGTEGYLPPEGPGTPQADLFSLGKVLYEMSTGMDRRRFAELPDDLREWPDRSAVFEFNPIVLRACAKDPAQRYQTADQLRADLALLQEGKSVRRSRSNQRLWSQLKKVALGLVLLVVVIAGVARLARQTLRNGSADDGPPSTNEQANALCARALLIVRGDNYASFGEAYTNFHRALAIDPRCIQAYVGLLQVPNVPLEEMRSIANRLSELAPDLAMTYCAQSLVAWFDLDLVKAKEYGMRAIQAGPDCGYARAAYSWMLADWGWPAEARKEIETALRLEPSRAAYYQLLGNTYFMGRDFPKAIATYREALRWESHRTSPYESMGKAMLAMGDPMGAISNFEQIPIILGKHDAASKAWYDELRRAVEAEGAMGYWRACEASFLKNPETSYYDHAVCQMHLGNTNGALALLEKSFATRERKGHVLALYVLVWDEVWDGVREHPRYRALLDKIGYTKVMPKRP